jgi:hypothetical protein
MLETILGISVALVGVGVFTQYQRQHGQLKAEQEKSADLYNKVILAEQAKTKSETELAFLQNSVVQLMQRPVVATLNDVQVNNLVGALLQYAEAVKDPGKMN